MSLRLLIPGCIVLIAAGVLVGRFGAGWYARATHAPRTARPDALEKAWRALEAGDGSLAAAAAGLDAEAMPTAAYADEVRLLQAIGAGDRAAVRALADAGAERTVGAQALAWLVDTAPANEREGLERLFAERYPDSWRVRQERRVQPGEGGR